MTIEIAHLTKRFGSNIAVSDVTATIEPGVTALLGPNGAGKSTLFRAIAGLVPPSSGSVTILGRDVRSDRAARALIGISPQQDALFEWMSVRDFVTVAARLTGQRDVAGSVQLALDRVQLSDVDKPIGTFSKGMRQRVKLAAALVGNPPVLILDEPLNGLDPVQRRRMIDLFRSLGDEGRTVLVSSHVLSEVAQIGSNVLIIVNGRLAASGDYRQLRALMNDRPQLLRVETDRPRQFAALLVHHGLADGVTVVAEGLHAQTMDIDRFRRYLAPLASDHQLGLYRVASLDDDLDSVFAYLTGQGPPQL